MSLGCGCWTSPRSTADGAEASRHGGRLGGTGPDHRIAAARSEHSRAQAKPLLFALNDEQKKRYLLPLIEGKKKTAFAQTEPDAGADPGSMRTTAVLQDDVYVIDGAKRFISFAADADFVQLVAATDRSKGSRGGLSVFLVDMNTAGVAVTRKQQKMMGDVTYELSFDNVRVPVENRVGE